MASNDACGNTKERCDPLENDAFMKECPLWKIVIDCSTELGSELSTELLEEFIALGWISSEQFQSICSKEDRVERNQTLFNAIAIIGSDTFHTLRKLYQRHNKPEMDKILMKKLMERYNEYLGNDTTHDLADGARPADLWKIIEADIPTLRFKISQDHNTIAHALHNRQILKDSELQRQLAMCTRDPADATSHLLVLLTRSGHQGYRAFMEALKEAEHGVLASTYTGRARSLLQAAGYSEERIAKILHSSYDEFNPDKEWWEKVFLPVTPNLRRYLEPKNILQKLLAVRVINRSDKMKVEAQCQNSETACDMLITILEKKTLTEYTKLLPILFEEGGAVAQIAKKLMRKQIRGEGQVKRKLAWELYRTTVSSQRRSEAPLIQTATRDTLLSMRLALDLEDAGEDTAASFSQQQNLVDDATQRDMDTHGMQRDMQHPGSQKHAKLKTMVVAGNDEYIDNLLYTYNVVEHNELSRRSNQPNQPGKLTQGSSICCYVNMMNEGDLEAFIVVRMHKCEECKVKESLIKIAMEASSSLLLLYGDEELPSQSTKASGQSKVKPLFSTAGENVYKEWNSQKSGHPLDFVQGMYNNCRCRPTLAEATAPLSFTIAQPFKATTFDKKTAAQRAAYFKEMYGWHCKTLPKLCQIKKLELSSMMAYPQVKFHKWFMNTTRATPIEIASVKKTDPGASKKSQKTTIRCFPTQQPDTECAETDPSAEYKRLDKYNPWKYDWTGIDGPADVTTVLADDETFAMDVIDCCCGGLMKLSHHTFDDATGQASLVLFSKMVGARIHNFLCIKGLKHLTDDSMLLIPTIALSSVFVICSKDPETALKRLSPALMHLGEQKTLKSADSQALNRSEVGDPLFRGRLLLVPTGYSARQELQQTDDLKEYLQRFFAGPFQQTEPQKDQTAQHVSQLIKLCLADGETACVNSSELSSYLSVMLSAISTRKFDSLSLTKIYEKEIMDFIRKVISALRDGRFEEQPCSNQELENLPEPSDKSTNDWEHDNDLILGLSSEIPIVRIDDITEEIPQNKRVHDDDQQQLICQLRHDLYVPSTMAKNGPATDNWKWDMPGSVQENLQGNLSRLVHRRTEGVKKQARQRVAELRYGIRNDALGHLDILSLQMHKTWSLCFNRCKNCAFSCLRPSGHAEEHPCNCYDQSDRAHLCAKYCTICEEAFDFEAKVCKRMAGHESSKGHRCQCWTEGEEDFPDSHRCKVACIYRDALIHQPPSGTEPVPVQCQCYIDHDETDDDIHICSRRPEEHMCAELCELRDGRAKCRQQHCDHETEKKSAHQNHLCGGEHLCSNCCEGPGVCHVSFTGSQPDEIFENSKFRESKNGYQLYCNQPIPAFETQHSRPTHNCGKPVTDHTCEKMCILCRMLCHKRYNHTGNCEVKHGKIQKEMRDHALIRCGRSHELLIFKDDAQCDTICSDAGRGHEHIIPAGFPRKDDEQIDEPSDLLMQRRTFFHHREEVPSPAEQHLVTHDYFWKHVLKTVDPYLDIPDWSQFRLCPMECPEQDKKFCESTKWHKLFAEGQGENWHVGHKRDELIQPNYPVDGHRFECRHKCKVKCTRLHKRKPCMKETNKDSLAEERSLCQFDMGHISDQCFCGNPHMCWQKCPAPNCQQNCCEEEQHTNTPCCCSSTKCGVLCPIQKCGQPCHRQGSKDDHLHGVGLEHSSTSSPTTIHHCNEVHPCNRRCNQDGICYLAEPNEVVSTTLFERAEGKGCNGFKRFCHREIPIAHWNHGGSGDHNCGNEHTCTAACPLCDRYCCQPIHGKEKPHVIKQHGKVSNAKDILILKADGSQLEASEIEGLRCDQICDRAGRGHVHLQCVQDHPMCSTPRCDGYYHKWTHTEYWQTRRIEDPYQTDEKKVHDFNGCPTKCNHADHKDGSEYCQGELFHPPHTELPASMDGAGYVGLECFGEDTSNKRPLKGCVFPCTHSCCGMICAYIIKGKQCLEECISPRNKHSSKCKCAKPHNCQGTCQADGCGKQCEEDLGHDENSRHSCGEPDCTVMCEWICGRPCSNGHHHTGSNHTCDEEHQCTLACQQPGICPESDNDESSTTAKESTAEKKRCKIQCPVGKSDHSKTLQHHCQGVHTCTVKCPLCKRYCTEPYGHTDGVHNVKHGLILEHNKVVVIDGNGKTLVDVDWSQLSCDQICERGGTGHHHNRINTAVIERSNAPLNHKKFWKQEMMQFSDPATPSQRAEYMRCPRKCTMKHNSDHDGATGTDCQLAVDHDGTTHMCDGRHRCDIECAEPGVCGEKSAGKLSCSAPIAAGFTEHGGKHTCGLRHRCERRCPWCDTGCVLVYKHGGDCGTAHSTILPHVLKELKIYRSGGNAPVDFTSIGQVKCNTMCKMAGDSHYHLALDCTCTGLIFSTTEEHRLHDAKSKKDFTSHYLFWQEAKFEDPYNQLESANFSACPVPCTLDGHIDKDRTRMCKGKLFHLPMKPADTDSTGIVMGDDKKELSGHKFDCDEHRCKKPCSVKEYGKDCTRGKCAKIEGHSTMPTAPKCSCGSTHLCSERCAAPGCDEYCVHDEKHRETSSGQGIDSACDKLGHDCDKPHHCKETCGHSGACVVGLQAKELIQQPSAQLIKVLAMNAVRLQCQESIPISKRSHEAGHMCDKPQKEHSCSATCPLCGYYCEASRGHTGQHQLQQHGPVTRSAKIGDGQGCTISTFREAVTCEKVCSTVDTSQHHHHIIPQKDYDAFVQKNPHEKLPIQMTKEGTDMYKVNHATFWKVHGFPNPATPDQPFDKCPVECPRSNEHPDRKEQCTRPLLHSTKPFKKSGPGFVSSANSVYHEFSCTEHKCKKGCQHKGTHMNCTELCTRELEHDGSCNCLRDHTCGATCDGDPCDKPCALVEDHPSASTRHWCKQQQCPRLCQHCRTNHCRTPDHFHGKNTRTSANVVHDCGNDHACSNSQVAGNRESMCKVTNGNCMAPQGLDHRREAVALMRRGKTIQETRSHCQRLIPSGMAHHEGGHSHCQNDAQPNHFCNVHCPMCGQCCTRTTPHDGEPHITDHQSVIQLYPKAETAVPGWYVCNKDGQHVKPSGTPPPTCTNICNILGAGHVHRRQCYTPECSSTDGKRHSNADGKQHDDYTHDMFWKEIDFEDPYEKETSVKFQHCPATCPDSVHDGEEPQRCLETHLHLPMKIQGHKDETRHLQDGHSFRCEHPCIEPCQDPNVCKLVENTSSGSVATNSRESLHCRWPKGHTGNHSCDALAEDHTCPAQCPFCASLCTRKIHGESDGLHTTLHGHHPSGQLQFTALTWSSSSGSVVAELTSPATCAEICQRSGRGHLHHQPAPAGPACHCAVGEKGESHWHSHNNFWKNVVKFEQPPTNAIYTESFAKCFMVCHEGHNHFCDLEMRHEPDISHGRHVRGGHRFPDCQDYCEVEECKSTFHRKPDSHCCCRIRGHELPHFCATCYTKMCRELCPMCGGHCTLEHRHSGRHDARHYAVPAETSLVYTKHGQRVDHNVSCPELCRDAAAGHMHVVQQCTRGAGAATATSTECMGGQDGIKHDAKMGADLCSHAQWEKLKNFTFRIAAPQI